MTAQTTLEAIAKEHLSMDTLATRRSGSEDFHELAVWSIDAALKAAFEAGQRSAASGIKPSAAQLAYAQRQAEARELIARLSNGLDAHSRRAALDSANWGYAGDLAEVCERLVQSMRPGNTY